MYINALGGGKSKDCLNTIRLLAAIQVLYGHAIAHLHIPHVRKRPKTEF